MREKLTVIIHCQNERMNLRPCVETARSIANEILIADASSTDGTVDIARSLAGCRVIERESIGAEDLLAYAIPRASHPWVFLLGADERVTPELAHEIRHVLSSPIADGYRVRRRHFCFGREMKHGGWRIAAELRLFRRDIVCAEHAATRGASRQVGVIHARLDRLAYWSLEQCAQEVERRGLEAAERRFALGRRAGLCALVLRAPLRFLYLYVARLGFLDGLAGLILCGLAASGEFNATAKLWAMHEAPPQTDPEAEHAATQAAGLKMLPDRKAA